MEQLSKGELVTILVLVLVVSVMLSFFISNFSGQTKTYKVVTTTGGPSSGNIVGVQGDVDVPTCPCP